MISTDTVQLFARGRSQCLPNSLSSNKVRGKIVVCLRGSGLRVEKGLEVKRAGGAAIILGNPPASGSEVPVDAHVLPGTAVSAADAVTILKYINSSSSPTAVLHRSRTVVDVQPSPVMAQFSSRGPNVLEPDILKVLLRVTKRNMTTFPNPVITWE
jgi:hypothetical protein